MPDNIIFSGENPGLTLYKPGTDQVIAKVSYWRCVYSGAGDGNAMLIWVDPEASGLGSAAPHAIAIAANTIWPVTVSYTST